VLADLHAYLLKIGDAVLPRSAAGQAVSYALKNWAALTRYCQDGALAIDNNHTERSLRGIAVGRNNWLFVGSDQGGRTMAILRSFVGSCELAKVNPSTGSGMCCRALANSRCGRWMSCCRIAGRRRC
jgi:hypothetical protein